MGRMHAPGKGISDSALPYKRTPPSWLKATTESTETESAWLARAVWRRAAAVPQQSRFVSPAPSL
jgi:hypothetical protein